MAGGIHGGKIFVGLIFVVEGTHENFNTTKISAYAVLYVSHTDLEIFIVKNVSAVTYMYMYMYLQQK